MCDILLQMAKDLLKGPSKVDLDNGVLGKC